MGFMDFLKELAGEDNGNKVVDMNDRSDFLDRAGALYICVNRDSRKVTSVRLCDFYSHEKEDTFESFIKQQVKQIRKLDFIPNESIFFYYVPDLGSCPHVHKEENDHFIPYLREMQPMMRIEMTDAVFAVKYGFDLVSDGRCFSGFSGKAGLSKRYREFIEANERDKMRVMVNFYLDDIEQDYKAQKGIARQNPVSNMLRKVADNEEAVKIVVDCINKRELVSALMMNMLMPVLYSTPWGAKNISDDEMLNYVAKNDMKYLGVEYRNKAMTDFFIRNGLIDDVINWCDAVSAMDDYVVHKGPKLSYEVKPLPGLTMSETLYQNILDKGAEIGRKAYLNLCGKMLERLRRNPYTDVSRMYPDFERADCPGARPGQANPYGKTAVTQAEPKNSGGRGYPFHRS
jgi:hypothetical protein